MTYEMPLSLRNAPGYSLLVKVNAPLVCPEVMGRQPEKGSKAKASRLRSDEGEAV